MEILFSHQEKQVIKDICIEWNAQHLRMPNKTLHITDPIQGPVVIVPTQRWKWEKQEQENEVLKGAV